MIGSVWKWESPEEFERRINPTEVKRAMVRGATHITLLERVRELLGLRDQLAESVDVAKREIKSNDLRAAREGLIGLPIYGERLLLYMRCLIEEPGVQDFLDYKHIAEKVYHSPEPPTAFDRTCAEKLLEGAAQLLRAFDGVAEASDMRFSEAHELPNPAGMDMQTARDLFSVGEVEAGFFFVCRSMEAVVRLVAKERGIVDDGKDGGSATLGNMLRQLSRTPSREGENLISRKDSALLEYARESRNALAHSGVGGETAHASSPRARNERWIRSSTGSSVTPMSEVAPRAMQNARSPPVKARRCRS